MARRAKSWHTPSRAVKTWATWVETVVDPDWYAKSEKIRPFRSRSTSTSGRPGVKLGAA